MLNKQILIGTSSNIPEPGYVPAKLTIGARTVEGGRYYRGYDWYRSIGDLQPNPVNGLQINRCYVFNRDDSYVVTTQSPFYYKGIKYTNSVHSEELYKDWNALVGNVVDIYILGGGHNRSRRTLRPRRLRLIASLRKEVRYA